MALLNRVKGLFKRTSSIPSLSAYGVQHEKLDEVILDDMLDHSHRFSDVMTSPVEITNDEGDARPYEQASNLRSDLFFAHHVGTDDVRMKSTDEVRPSAHLNTEIMRHLIQHEDFLKTRPMTRRDDVASTLATMAAEGVLMEELQTTLKDQAELASQAQNEEEKIRQYQEMLEKARAEAKELHDKGEAIPDELKQVVKDAIAGREQAGDTLETIAGEIKPGSGQVESAVGAAVAAGKELADVYMSLPGVGIGAGQRIPPEAAIELAYKWRNADKLKRVAELIGRLERDFRWKRSNRVIGGDDIIVGVEVGAEIRKLLPHEFALFGHPVLKRKFYRDFAAKQLLQYEMIGEASASKGPVIICIDDSGSMSGPREEWAKGVALALTSIAHREKREVYIISFSGYVSGEWHFKVKGGIDPELATDFAMSFNGGGTDITEALKRAKEVYLTMPAFKTADIVLITDGSDYMEEDDLELKAWFAQEGVRLQGVVIGGMPTTPYTATICDDEVAVSDLTGSSEATDRIVQGLT